MGYLSVAAFFATARAGMRHACSKAITAEEGEPGATSRVVKKLNKSAVIKQLTKRTFILANGGKLVKKKAWWAQRENASGQPYSHRARIGAGGVGGFPTSMPREFSPPTFPQRTRKNGAPSFLCFLDLRFAIAALKIPVTIDRPRADNCLFVEGGDHATLCPTP
jgi:hypothetical protein